MRTDHLPALQTLLPLALLLAGSVCAQERPVDDPNPLTETQRIQHFLSRFSFGPTPGLVEQVRKVGLDKWMDRWLEDEVEPSKYLAERLRDLETIGLDSTTIVRRFSSQKLRNKPREELKDAVLFRSIYGANQLEEVATDFWRNHFNVDINKGNVRYYATEYENAVIRKHVLGPFGQLLEASAKHPAMLVYLDNAISRRPPTKQELREIERNTRRKTKSAERAQERVEIAKQRGLNENYARELLELHTLGVDNYYKQKDVIAVAKALTGWTVQNDPKQKIGFRFRADMHEKEDQVVLGSRIRDDRKQPLEIGEKILKKLARHKGTSHFIAWKLCRYFVNDKPSEAMVKRVASAFRRSRGKLADVYRAIVKDREFFAPANFQAKYKRPYEFVVSALRVTGAEVRSTRDVHRYLALMSEPIYECEDPTGYYDQAEAWNDPGTMAVRWKFALDLVRGRIRGIRVPDKFYEGLHPKLPLVWKDQLAARVLPAGLSEKTSKALDRQIRGYLEDRQDRGALRDLPALILGMLLGSPEFQRQ